MMTIEEDKACPKWKQMMGRTVHYSRGAFWLLHPSEQVEIEVSKNNWELTDTTIFERCVDRIEGAQVVDIGANIGWYSVLACKHGAAHVHAFEGCPQLSKVLGANVALNGLAASVTVHQAMLQRSGPTIDELLPNASCDLLKIDTDGYDIQILEGSATLLKSMPIIQFEVIGVCLAQYEGKDPDTCVHRLFDILRDAGYRHFGRAPNLQVITPEECCAYNKVHGSLNVYAVPAGKLPLLQP